MEKVFVVTMTDTTFTESIHVEVYDEMKMAQNAVKEMFDNELKVLAFADKTPEYKELCEDGALIIVEDGIRFSWAITDCEIRSNTN